MTKRLLAIILTLALMLGAFSGSVCVARAAEVYDVSAAVAFANKYWNDGVGLCGEFVSRCLAAGGITIPNKAKYYSSTTMSYEGNRGTLGAYTNPYKCPASLLLYLAERYEVITAPDKSVIEVGDIVFMPGGTGGPYNDGHVGIIISTTGGVPVYAAHNNATNTGKFYSNNPCTYVVKMGRPLDGSSSSSGDSSSATTTTCDCSATYAGTYICTTESTSLRIRSGHGTSYSQLGSIPRGAEVTVTKASGTGDSDWAHVTYDGISGYVSMAYLTAKASTYTVTYNANGGSGAPGSQTKTHGTTLTLSSTAPTRTGYTFQGWAISASATTADYQPGASFAEDGDTTLYAVWKANTYTVTYNANGGSGAPGSQTKTHGTTLTLSSTVPTRTGYTFLGWSTSAGATAADYQSGGSFKTNSDTTLYAVWKVTTYTVTYNANGGSGAPGSQTKTHGTALTLSSTVPTRTGYTFLGWAASAKATSATYQPSDSYTADSKITLYAVWKANTYTVIVDANGGVDAPESQEKTHDIALTLPSTAPTRTGYTFLGWSTSADATEAEYLPQGNFLLEGDTTLYAVWQADIYVITYDANGGVDAPEGQEKTHDIPLILNSTIPTRAGYVFLGWSASMDAAAADYQPGASFTLEGDTILYAVWAADTYTVTYDANGGTDGPASQAKAYGIDLILSSVIPTRTGYTFLGWATGSNAAVADYQPGASFATEGNTTLYALWELSTYTVSYHANSGTTVPDSQTKIHGMALTLSSEISTRTGYTFLGWATSIGATAADYQPGDSLTVDGNCQLYAVWHLNENSNGNSSKLSVSNSDPIQWARMMRC